MSESTYWRMWERIKGLNVEGAQKWLDELGPSKGRVVDFMGMNVIDVDLREALTNWVDYQ